MLRVVLYQKLTILFFIFLSSLFYSGCTHFAQKNEQEQIINETVFIIQNDYNGGEYVFDTQQIKMVLDQLQEPLSRYVLRITNDPTSSTFHQYWDGKKISGVNVLYENKSGTIIIYLDDNLDNDRQIYELSNQFINGMFFIDMEKSNPTGSALDYSAASNKANTIFMMFVEKNKLPVKEI